MFINDFDVQQMVARELEPRERLLWSGRPGQGLRVRRADAFMIPFSLMWAGFMVFWEASAFRENAPFFFRLWGVPFILIGIYLVVGRFVVDAWQRRNTVYAVTDCRIVVISGQWSRTTTSHPLQTLAAVTLAESSSHEGDVVLAATDMRHVGAGGMVQRGQSVPPALEFLAEARNVYEIIRAAQRRPDKG